MKETPGTLSAIITIFLSCATVSLRPCTSANAGWTPFARDNFFIAREARFERVRCRAWSYAIVYQVYGAFGLAVRCGSGRFWSELRLGWRQGSEARRVQRKAWRARAERRSRPPVAGRSRSAAGPMSGARSARRRLFYGYLRELPAPRAEGTREAVGAGSGRAR